MNERLGDEPGVAEGRNRGNSRNGKRARTVITDNAGPVQIEVPRDQDGQVRNRPVYAAIGVDLAGHKDILGTWAGDGDGESAKARYAVLTDLRSRGVRDLFFVVCDGLRGLPDSVNAVFPAAVVQTCITHLIRGAFRYASWKYWDELARDLKPIYQAPTAGAAAEALHEGNCVSRLGVG